MKISKKTLQEIITEEISNYSSHSKLRSLNLLMEALEDPNWKPHLSPEQRDALHAKVLSYHEDHWEKKGAAWAPGVNEWENDPPWPFSTDAQEDEELHGAEVKMLQDLENSFEPGGETFDGKITSQHLKFLDELGGERLKTELSNIEDNLGSRHPEEKSSIEEFIDDFYGKIELAFLKMKRSEGRKILGFYAKLLKQSDEEEKISKEQLHEIVLEEFRNIFNRRNNVNENK